MGKVWLAGEDDLLLGHAVSENELAQSLYILKPHSSRQNTADVRKLRWEHRDRNTAGVHQRVGFFKVSAKNIHHSILECLRALLLALFIFLKEDRRCFHDLC